MGFKLWTLGNKI